MGEASPRGCPSFLLVQLCSPNKLRIEGFWKDEWFSDTAENSKRNECVMVWGKDEPISLSMCGSSPLASQGIRISWDCKPLLAILLGDVDFRHPFGK